MEIRRESTSLANRKKSLVSRAHPRLRRLRFSRAWGFLLGRPKVWKVYPFCIPRTRDRVCRSSGTITPRRRFWIIHRACRSLRAFLGTGFEGVPDEKRRSAHLKGNLGSLYSLIACSAKALVHLVETPPQVPTERGRLISSPSPPSSPLPLASRAQMPRFCLTAAHRHLP